MIKIISKISFICLLFVTNVFAKEIIIIDQNKNIPGKVCLNQVLHKMESTSFSKITNCSDFRNNIIEQELDVDDSTIMEILFNIKMRISFKDGEKFNYSYDTRPVCSNTGYDPLKLNYNDLPDKTCIYISHDEDGYVSKVEKC